MSSLDTTSPRVAVVTVSYASDGVLPALLASIPKASGEATAVVVVDNLPTVGDSARIAADHQASYLPLPANPGYGAGMNAGVRILPESVEWLLVVNPDVTLSPGSVLALLAHARSTPDAGAVGPLIRDTAGKVYPSAREVPSLRTGIGHAVLGSIWPNNPFTRAYRSENVTPSHPRDAGWLSGACALIRRNLFDQLGGFDENYFMYFEDVDLGVRIRRAGFRNIYYPDAEVTHTGGHSTKNLSAEMVHAHHISARRFLSRKYPGVLLWPVRTALSLGLRLREMLAARGSRK